MQLKTRIQSDHFQTQINNKPVDPTKFLHFKLDRCSVCLFFSVVRFDPPRAHSFSRSAEHKGEIRLRSAPYVMRVVSLDLLRNAWNVEGVFIYAALYFPNSLHDPVPNSILDTRTTGWEIMNSVIDSDVLNVGTHIY